MAVSFFHSGKDFLIFSTSLFSEVTTSVAGFEAMVVIAITYGVSEEIREYDDQLATRSWLPACLL